MDLESLLLDVQGLSGRELEKFARENYERLYINSGHCGIHKTHDGEDVVFWRDRFEHTFWTSSNRGRNPYAKDKLATDRIERMAWIGPLIAGNVPGSGCWEVAGEGRRIPPNRLYVAGEQSFIVWLEPRMKGGWKFSTAYCPPVQEIRRYCHGGRKIWSFGDVENIAPRD